MPAKKPAKKAPKTLATAEVVEGASAADTKQRAINLAIKEIQTKFGDESIMTYGSGKVAAIESIPTGPLGSEERRVGKKCR